MEYNGGIILWDSCKSHPSLVQMIVTRSGHAATGKAFCTSDKENVFYNLLKMTPQYSNGPAQRCTQQLHVGHHHVK